MGQLLHMEKMYWDILASLEASPTLVRANTQALYYGLNMFSKKGNETPSHCMEDPLLSNI